MLSVISINPKQGKSVFFNCHSIFKFLPSSIIPSSCGRHIISLVVKGIESLAFIPHRVTIFRHPMFWRYILIVTPRLSPGNLSKYPKPSKPFRCAVVRTTTVALYKSLSSIPLTFNRTTHDSIKAEVIILESRIYILLYTISMHKMIKDSLSSLSTSSRASQTSEIEIRL